MCNEDVAMLIRPCNWELLNSLQALFTSKYKREIQPTKSEALQLSNISLLLSYVESFPTWLRTYYNWLFSPPTKTYQAQDFFVFCMQLINYLGMLLCTSNQIICKPARFLAGPRIDLTKQIWPVQTQPVNNRVPYYRFLQGDHLAINDTLITLDLSSQGH